MDQKTNIPLENVVLDEKPETKKEDHYAIDWEDDDNSTKWSDKTTKEKIFGTVFIIVKIILAVACLYLFICSISMLGDGFQILAGKTAGEVFSNDSFLSNPLTGLIIGILVTALVQSSSTSTSIVITMVASGILPVHIAIPIIMGSNIGTSVTNTIVAMTQSLDKNDFRRAFAGATVLDVFNLLTVLVFFPLERVSGYLEVTTGAIIDSFNIQGGSDTPDLLKVLTDPVVLGIVRINDSVISLTAQDIPLEAGSSMIDLWCEQTTAILNRTTLVNVSMPLITEQQNTATVITPINQSISETVLVGIRLCKSPDDFLFANTGLSDLEAGIIILVTSLIILTSCLILMVKLLNSMMHGTVSRLIKKVINIDFKYPFGWVAGYIAILVGAGLTFVVQSSSVFTSTLTPLVGMGMISLERMYPLTLGANIGTTTTGIFAALASDPDRLEYSLQIALVHLFFNVSGIALWYPVPFLRRIPLKGAKALGNTTAEYRWFAVLYILFVFFLIPLLLLGLSFADFWAMMSFVILVLAILFFVTVTNLLQTHRPQWLPAVLRSWKFLPEWMRSLRPYDTFFTKYLLCQCCCKPPVDSDSELSSSASSIDGCDNEGFDAGLEIVLTKL
uniref:sodium-dependent phosphate transport protein 2B-like n=1 Tax=Ciona intestinalis TaxID=7719 RepID=UPI000180B011|nr:sodium-dependent phosphate transport protein 2B-like [Ciona intestinalis]|eukprot:XP_018672441.1 sodium-dependent phosphate transport protein 2B-like [Ciona intestinalis]